MPVAAAGATHTSATKTPKKGPWRNGVRNIGLNTWEMRVTFPRDALTGKQPSHTKVFHGAYEEAVAERASMLAQASVSPRGGARATVGDLMDAWLTRCEDRNKKGALADSTFENYAYQVRRLRKSAPNFLAIRLSKLDSSEPVEELLKGLEEDHGVGQSGLVQTHKAIRAAMEWGIGRKWLKFNAAKYVEDKPAPPKKKTPKATVEEVRLLIETAPQVHPDLAAYFLTAALTGLRRQALTGLMWGDFDWDKQTVTINRVRNSVWGKVQTVAWAKHRKGKPAPVHLLDPVVVDTLHALHNAQLERCKQTGTTPPSDRTPPSDGWVFSYDGMGLTPMEPDYVQRHVKAIGDLAGLPYRSHDMRHHRGTELIAAGVDVARVAAELDHEDISLTLRTYVGATPAGDTVITALGRQYVNTDRLDQKPVKKAATSRKIAAVHEPVLFKVPRRSRRSAS